MIHNLEFGYIIIKHPLQNQDMVKLQCKDYGFECEFHVEGEDTGKVIVDFGKHTEEEHGIEYSKESLMQFIMRKG